jgi:RNA polymerase sigma-70 factor (ECF subfamily)
MELVRRAAAGDDDAFRRLVGSVLPRLRRWALARTGNPDQADEVVQRTLIRAHRGLDRFAGDSRLTSWL